MIIRKNQKNLTNSEWDKFILAVTSIRGINAFAPNYSALAQIHTPKHHQRTAHRFPEFLPWHREYIWTFEQRLIKENSDITLPYWNWLENRKIPSKLAKASDWGVTRGMDAKDKVGNYQPEVDKAMKETTFRGFHLQINGPHGGIHIDIGGMGGEMGNIMRSPEDILFWLHHCFLDKLWVDWQNLNQNAEPDMPKKLLPISNFSRTGNDVKNISNMGYSYQ